MPVEYWNYWVLEHLRCHQVDYPLSYLTFCYWSILIRLLRTYLLNTCHVPNTGLDAQGRNSSIRSLALGAYPLGAYSLQWKEEERSNEIPQGVEDDKLAWPLLFSLPAGSASLFSMNLFLFCYRGQHFRWLYDSSSQIIFLCWSFDSSVYYKCHCCEQVCTLIFAWFSDKFLRKMHRRHPAISLKVDMFCVF